MLRSRKNSLKEQMIRKLILGDYIWEYIRLLRRLEYLTNKKRNMYEHLNFAIQYRQFAKLSLKLGIYINPNNFGPGLRLIHPGSIFINAGARIGANCVLFHDVTIGFERRYMKGDPPRIGDNVYIGPGVKIFGSIVIADNIARGANSVVNNSFNEPGITIAGIPAKKVSEKGSENMVLHSTELSSVLSRLSWPVGNYWKYSEKKEKLF